MRRKFKLVKWMERIWKRNFCHALSTILLVFVSGCSSMMALSDKAGADMQYVRVGQDRSVLIEHYGDPVDSFVRNGRSVDVFEVRKGKEASVGRAAQHLAANALTYGTWEIFGASTEAFEAGIIRFQVEYDEFMQVKRIQSDRSGLKSKDKKNK